MMSMKEDLQRMVASCPNDPGARGLLEAVLAEEAATVAERVSAAVRVWNAYVAEPHIALVAASVGEVTA